MSAIAGTPSAEPTDTALPHPRGLYILFATEMWERFSYYGMRALLVLYLINFFSWQPHDSSTVYKWYTSLVYLTPLAGGYLADRYLGLRVSIITGAVLMAVGHFLMAFESLPFLFSALGFLILGNGFFKPNISTLVGKLYTAEDKRRDGAFTIFYMGINLGAFLSPLVCGWLRTRFGFNYGFGAAGVGMVIGGLVFVLGQGRVMADVKAAGNVLLTGRQRQKAEGSGAAAAPGAAEKAGAADELKPGLKGVPGAIATALPFVLIGLAVLLPVQFAYKLITQQARWYDLIMPFAFSGIAGWMGFNLRTIKGAGRDKSSVIFLLFVFAVIFWMAFEQAGNALNIFAEYHTRLNLFSFDYPAEWFQSVNPVLIVTLAPLFAAFWLFLAKRNAELSTPGKMLVAMVFMGLSFLVMVFGAVAENSTTSRVPLSAMPAAVDLAKVDAGRMAYDAAARELSVRGALPPFAMSEALGPTVDPAYGKSVDKLEDASGNATEKHPVTVRLGPLPDGYALSFDDKAQRRWLVGWDAATGNLTVKAAIDAPTRTRLLAAGAPTEYRTAITALAEKSNAARVSGFWLFLSYLLATMGELCLSPVGLSMVTKLAPVRFASLFMGVWLLSSSLAQYVGGTLGEMWGTVPPTSYFTIFVYTSIAGAALLVLLVRPLRKLMHGVN